MIKEIYAIYVLLKLYHYIQVLVLFMVNSNRYYNYKK